MAIERVLKALGRARVLPILRTSTAEDAHGLATRMLLAGLPIVEVTATIPDWPGVLAALCAEHPGALIGVGTIVTADDARRALDTGADFLVSPYPVPPVREVAGDLLIEGGFTPAEVAAAAGNGIAKLFPAHVGGPTYLSSLLAVMPGASVVPTGGVRLAEVPRWLAAGALAVGVGRDLTNSPDPAAALARLLDGAG